MTLRHRLHILWRLLRPYTLVAAVVPVLIGTGLAFTKSSFHPGLFISFLLAAILIQSATNIFNEYFDFRRGLDNDKMTGIAGAIVRDGVRPRTVLALAWGFILISVVLGAYICSQTTWWIALLGSVCIAVAYFYSGGPKPLSYTPFGELAASVAMGPVIVLIGFYIETQDITTRAVVASLPIGLLIGAILLGNNIRDIEHDKRGGRRTIAILLGPEGGRILFAGVYVITYIIILALIVLGMLTPWALLVLLTVPSGYAVVKGWMQSRADANKLQAAFKGTALQLLRVGASMFVGLAAAAWIHF
ncbi:1,4-dihydroxy-2-naphthoate polyprenyltransferase [Alicyclobacillus sp. SO9]|uniref:1,4-dihydroxy-2-naphthoate polyprenyltransferase n=1 Tax=Alicyclobacillus sp. SO9 TaxID=2665646 RepID=UPI0018E8A0D7|nr:1,4-dihydroxy-2-naphthoate polyprenyltransferase [Alicyclobacillus sp. SO9]QQE77166.1 1,4-dihydroxy-2-naphthoate polyprenyltransferase [Alicyclobacillus sp. SO9]